VIALEGTTLYLATTREFLLECQQRKAGLDQNPDFQRALAEVGREGNALGYVSPRFVARLRQLGELNPQATPQVKRVLDIIARTLPVLERPVVTVRINQADGILVRSVSYRSLKQEVALVAIYNPVTIGGLAAAMAIPAFQKVRQASQDKAITNNLRQLGAAADQYYLENGVDSVTYGKLVGPDKYIKQIKPVAGENYRALKFNQGEPLRIRTADGRVIEYNP
jgi:type IV pilus assembly protein PilA